MSFKKIIGQDVAVKSLKAMIARASESAEAAKDFCKAWGLNSKTGLM